MPNAIERDSTCELDEDIFIRIFTDYQLSMDDMNLPSMVKAHYSKLKLELVYPCRERIFWMSDQATKYRKIGKLIEFWKNVIVRGIVNRVDFYNQMYAMVFPEITLQYDEMTDSQLLEWNWIESVNTPAITTDLMYSADPDDDPQYIDANGATVAVNADGYGYYI